MDKVVHFEIPFEDQKRSEKFYKDIFGWEIMKYPMEKMEYYGVRTVKIDKDHIPIEKGAINGGMQKRSKSMLHPVLVISVKNIDESMKKIEASGGKIVHKKINIGNMEIYARFQDTEENIVGLWQDL